MNLHDAINSGRILLLDGAMGTHLETSGLEMGGQNCISHPSDVLSAHRRYSDTGCDILTANTLTMNRISIETHGPGLDIKDVNLAGVRLAKEAASEKQYVLGDISSTGQLLEPYGNYSEEQFHSTFREQAEYLLEGGVDGFIVETVLDLREAVCALRACRDISSLPVLVSLSFQTADDGGRTIMGNRAGESAVSLVETGAAAVGANCGNLDPHETSLIISMMRECVDVPLVAQPNAGKPRLVNNQTIFDMTEEDFANGIAECIKAGATIVGGCCGTTPKHIQQVADKIINKIM
ncbi:homocysteine S-methyltransferase family protein [Thermodesulfobacteriota bacterium]